MASVSAFNHLHSICRAPSHRRHQPSPPLQLHLSSSPLQRKGLSINSCPPLKSTHKLKRTLLRFAAEETPIPEQPDESAAAEATAESVEGVAATAVDQTVSVPVSPSDKLMMHFQAEGTMNEAIVPKVTKALEETDGVSDLRVQVFEGIASVELTKETTIQATGVASALVEIIQGSGFKLHTLNLSFVEEEELVA